MWPNVSRNETFHEFFNWTDLSVYKERKGEGRREGRANDNDGVTASGANHRLIVGESESWVHGREKEDSRKLYLFLL